VIVMGKNGLGLKNITHEKPARTSLDPAISGCESRAKNQSSMEASEKGRKPNVIYRHGMPFFDGDTDCYDRSTGMASDRHLAHYRHYYSRLELLPLFVPL